MTPRRMLFAALLSSLLISPSLAQDEPTTAAEPPPVEATPPTAAPVAQPAPTAGATRPAVPVAAPATPKQPVTTKKAESKDERLVTRSAHVAIRSFTPEETLEAAINALEPLGAYIQSSETGSAQLRIPAQNLEKAMEALKGVGEVVDESVNSEDVGLEVVQLRAKIGEVEKSRARILEMLTLSNTVSDSVLIERQLQEITQTLEGHQGRLRYLERRVAETPLALSVSMKARPKVERMPAHRRPHDWVQSYGLGNLLP